MRPTCRALVDRLRLHCDQVGIRPPAAALRRYSTLRYLEATWYARAALTEERRELLGALAERLRLFNLRPGTPLCGPDLADEAQAVADLDALAPWPAGPLTLGLRDFG